MNNDATTARRFNALVLAADRTARDPVALAAGVAAKAFTPVGGRAMLLRVLDALDASPHIGRIAVCGPPRELLPGCPELLRRIESGAVHWVAPEATPAGSAMTALDALAQTEPVLLTTADHALLHPGIIDHFCRGAIGAAADACAGLVRHELIRAALPESRRTVLKFSDGGCCSCNLFALLTPAGREVVSFWRRVETERKRPWRVIAGALGPGAMLAYAAGRLRLDAALAQLSQRLGLRARAVILPFFEAAVDVDTPADLAQAEMLLQRRGG